VGGIENLNGGARMSRHPTSISTDNSGTIEGDPNVIPRPDRALARLRRALLQWHQTNVDIFDRLEQNAADSRSRQKCVTAILIRAIILH